ncbi:hypothetical protein LNQ81_12980 [Myroides sp. M-43]|uniref:hypothetical protein n=1 Tax=Myroides oncorhynchi TaxID=2893756 RepID=UPI001E376BF0|nr:hypothetical protein [Myroides oncorhynchi]MCC9043588.1 hypothetical protein [Myroides oncorhynchi]
MKKKLRLIGYIIITVSLMILISQLYSYNSETSNVSESTKEICISLLNGSIGLLLLYKSRKIKE